MRLPEGLRAAGYRFFHPALLDACLQAVAAALPASKDASEAFLPLALGELSVFAAAGAQLLSHARIRLADAPETVLADVTITDESGARVAELTGLRLKKLRPRRGRRAATRTSGTRLRSVRRRCRRLARPRRPGRISPRSRRRWSPSSGRSSSGPDWEPTRSCCRSIEALSAEYVRNAMLQLGWTLRPGERVSSDGLAARLGVAADRSRLFGRLLEILGEAGVLSGAGPSGGSSGRSAPRPARSGRNGCRLCSPLTPTAPPRSRSWVAAARASRRC